MWSLSRRHWVQKTDRKNDWHFLNMLFKGELVFILSGLNSGISLYMKTQIIFWSYAGVSSYMLKIDSACVSGCVRWCARARECMCLCLSNSYENCVPPLIYYYHALDNLQISTFILCLIYTSIASIWYDWYLWHWGFLINLHSVVDDTSVWKVGNSAKMFLPQLSYEVFCPFSRPLFGSGLVCT